MTESNGGQISLPLNWRVRRFVLKLVLKGTERCGTHFKIGPKHLARLTVEERENICTGLRLLWPDKYKNIHQGMLPFVPAENILRAVWLTCSEREDTIMRKLSWRMYFWHKLYEAL